MNILLRDAILENFELMPPPSQLLEEGIYEFLYAGVLEIREAFQGKYWNELDFTKAEKNDLMFAFGSFTIEARQYYFPGLMLIFLNKEPREQQDLLCQSLIWAFDFEHYYYEGFGDYLLGLNPKQEKVVALFLKEMLDCGDWEAKKALEHYWDMYL